jgi:hypothetical protein
MSKKFATPSNLTAITSGYAGLLADIKQRIRAAQVRTAMAGNASMLMLYWEIGGVLAQRQKQEGWGAAVLPRLATDLRNDLPEVKGFSVRNLKLMTQFFREYPDFAAIGQPPVALLAERPSAEKIRRLPVSKLLHDATSDTEAIGQLPVALLPWAHNIILNPESERAECTPLVCAASLRARLESRCSVAPDTEPSPRAPGQSCH